jgi:hypothetical protein
MPAGADETVLVAVLLPVLVTVNVYVLSVKVAVTAVAAVTVVVHGAVPVQPPPLQPTNEALLAGLAVRVTAVPWA